MDIATLHTAWTLVVVVVFLGIVAWAWSSRNDERFEAASQIPLLDDEANAIPDREYHSTEGE